jgi:hypothetical protein
MFFWNFYTDYYDEKRVYSGKDPRNPDDFNLFDNQEKRDPDGAD